MEKQTLLNNDNIINGVTYFKLVSDLEGDYTKNCGLLGEEIDNNFYFLRGYDIKNIYMDNNRNIIIERVNQEYKPFKINIDDSINLLDLELDKEHGNIILHYPNGAEKKIEGLLIKGNEIEFITDGSIEGKGTLSKPLKISNMEKTGLYRPVSEFLDLTNGNIMPSGKEKGYRILTKEYLNTFGCLYSLDSLNVLQKILIDNNSEWRVPSKQDWDELLNAMEINNDAKNHSLETSGWHGEVAGIALKSSKYWKKHETNNNDIPVDGQNISGLNILPLGIGTNRNEVLNEIDSDIEGFSKIAGFWSNTLDLNNNAYVKIFGYNSAKVGQDTYGKGTKMSIRLVKDFNGDNYNEVENILDELYPTVLVNSVCSNENYSKIWTSINFHDTKNIDGVTSKEWAEIEDINEISDIYFFINEWNGKEWRKKLLNDGDSIVIEANDNKLYHEWRIVKNNLIDTLVDAYDAVNDETNRAIIAENELKDFIISHVDKELKPYATISYVEDLIVGLEEGNVELGGYVKLETLQSSITETKKELINYTNEEINNLEDIYANKNLLETLIGPDSGISVRHIAAEEVAKIVASADSKFDTLKEIADYIISDSESAAQIVNEVSQLKAVSADTRLTVLEKKVSDLENHIKILEDKIDKNNGGNIPILPEEIKTLMKDYIVGKNNEIKIESNADDTKLLIGFADDAIFG